MGFGVKPSQVGAQIQQNATVKKLQNTVQKLKQDLAMLFETNQHNQAEQAASGGVMSGIGNEVNSGDKINGAKRNGGDADKVKERESNQYADLLSKEGAKKIRLISEDVNLFPKKRSH